MEYDASDSSGSSALTASTPPYAAGYETEPLPSLPAAATTSAPWLAAYVTAFCIVFVYPPPPSERLMTSAPSLAAHVIASAMSAVDPEPRSERARPAITLEFPIPVTPLPLLTSAAAMPATCVPWISSFSESGYGSPSSSTKSRPPLDTERSMLPSRSGWSYFTLVDDADRDACIAGRGVPRLGGIDLLVGVLIAEAWVVGHELCLQFDVLLDVLDCVTRFESVDELLAH